MQQLESGSFLQGGKYKIEEVLEYDNSSISYIATHELLERKVIITEFFDAKYCERDEATGQVVLGAASDREKVELLMEEFIKKARTYCAIHYPSDIFKENNTAYYVMEYIEVKFVDDEETKMNVPFEELQKEAEEYYNQHAVQILNDKGFFKMKKDRERSTMWTCSLVCMGLAFVIIVAMLNADFGLVFNAFGYFLIFIAVSFAGGIGMYIGMLFVWLRDRTLLNSIADKMKYEFVKEYIEIHQ